jgi:hypothetical protein
MIAQVFLTALLLVILLYAWLEYNRSPFVGIISMLAALTGLYFVWFPAHASRIAELVGIGRGVDLILYTWVAITFIVLLNLHLKVRAQMELITQLARELTLMRASPMVAELPSDRAGPSSHPAG